MAYQILNKANKSAEIHLYEDIGEGWFGGVSAKSFMEDLKALGNLNQLDVRINSPGGSVFDGVTIYNVLKSNSANVTTYVDGLAASIASIIAMAGDQIHMADNALMMIHDPWGMSMGTAEDMRAEANVLDTVKQTLIDTYAKRTGQEKALIAEMMANETWMDAEQAKSLGFADTITEEAKMAAAVDVSRYHYRKAPEAIAAAPSKKANRDARIERMRGACTRLVPQAVRKRAERAKSC